MRLTDPDGQRLIKSRGMNFLQKLKNSILSNIWILAMVACFVYLAKLKGLIIAVFVIVLRYNLFSIFYWGKLGLLEFNTKGVSPTKSLFLFLFHTLLLACVIYIVAHLVVKLE